MAESGVFVQKRLYSDFFIIKRKLDGLGGVPTYYKAKVESLAGPENGEIIHFGQMDADSDEVIVKRKLWSKDTHKYDVHIAESLINQGLLRDVRYIKTGLSK